MSLLLIDTDIASFIFKGSDYADPYLSLLNGQELAVSFMTYVGGLLGESSFYFPTKRSLERIITGIASG